METAHDVRGLPTWIRVGIFLARPVSHLVKALRAKAKYPPFGRKNWLNEAADDVVRQCFRDGFIPEVLIATGMGGLSFSQLLAKRFPGPRTEIIYVDASRRPLSMVGKLKSAPTTSK